MPPNAAENIPCTVQFRSPPAKPTPEPAATEDVSATIVDTSAPPARALARTGPAQGVGHTNSSEPSVGTVSWCAVGTAGDLCSKSHLPIAIVKL